ncbi:MAG: hypothetical protein AAFN50_09005 [Pseudomonadota bacterium]
MSKQIEIEGWRVPLEKPVKGNDAVPGDRKRLKDVDVVSLEVVDPDDFGTDPYNRTGSFCIPDFEED